jgi:hypothetical protein
MAGMFGIKQGLLPYKIQEAYDWWSKEYKSDDFWDDTFFLVDVIYPDVKFECIFHDEYFDHESPHFKKPFKVPVDEKQEFVGQAYDFTANGDEYAIYRNDS